MGLPLLGVEALGVDHVEVIDVVEPDALGAAFPCDRGVKYWKLGAKDIIHKCAFS